jgi:hypothetical protein
MTRREWLRKFIAENNIKSFCEIGVDEGWTFEEVVKADLDLYIVVERIIKYKLYDRIQRSEQIDDWGKTKKPLIMMRMESTIAARYIANYSLDMIFIDADHDYKSVLDDIIAWVPKVKEGGIIAGHDYDPTGGFDVWRVVDYMFFGVNFNLIEDDAGGPNNKCWWLTKDDKLCKNIYYYSKEAEKK